MTKRISVFLRFKPYQSPCIPNKCTWKSLSWESTLGCVYAMISRGRTSYRSVLDREEELKQTSIAV